jgi:chitinase
VDIDWEYPVSGGLPGNTIRPEDKKYFTLLLQKLREKLDKRCVIDNKHYLLTIAGGCESSYISNTEISLIQQYLDSANVMTYDIHGT